MTRPLQVIAIGAGYFAQFHLQAWCRLPQVNLAAIVDHDAATRCELQTLYPDTLVCPTLFDAVKKVDADIIDIITPPHTHESQITGALDQSKALIICQKPFCGSLKAALQITQKIADQNRTLVVHENFRFQPWYSTIKTILDNNQLGQVLQATFRLRTGDGQGVSAYLDRQPYFRTMPRFLIHETGIHWIDIFRYLFGEPDALSADLRRLNPHIAGEDAGHFIFHYDNGLRAQFDGNRHLDHAADNTRHTLGEMQIEGTEATLQLNGDGEIMLRDRQSKEGRKINYNFQPTEFGGDCVYRLQAHVVEYLTNGTKLHNTAQDYLNNLRLEETIYQAAESHSLITVGPKDQYV